ncbi:MAG: hypothetical protein HW386_1205 [Gammaproteobacteria bacterium]|nr:hypothetical protein [Gammaproteobacteria bacterium]
MRMNIILRITVLLLLLPGLTLAQTAAERRDKLGNMIMKHPGQMGALAPENLDKNRPAPPFNLTGTWFVDLSEGFAKFMFGPPYPEFIGQAKLDFEEGQRMRAARKPYRDAIGQCFPAGIPMIMTRVWPIAMVQTPTVVYMIANFNNSFRQIFLDGRGYSDQDTIIYTYNGESLGHWDGDTLVVDTRYIETYNHYIDTGIPISEDFRVQERIRLLENGEVLEIEYIMTDPQGWVGEWRNTKRWLRVDETDINEVECLPDLNDNLPSTQAGEVGLER